MGSKSTDRQTYEMILQALNLIHKPGDVIELRILNTKKGTVSGYFDDFQALANVAKQASGKAPAIYITLNLVRRELLARANNRVKTYVKTTTADADIIKRIWLGIDVDSVRPKDISSTDKEHTLALDKAKEIRTFLKGKGWPDPILGDSGNGGHLLYKIDLPNDNDARDLIKRDLEVLDLLFSDEQVRIDTGVFNAARIWKLYGTLTCKGDSTPERPHGLAQILEVPSDIETVSKEQLYQLATMLPEVPKSENKSRGSYKPLNIEQWITEHGLSIRRMKSWQGGMVYELTECPFSPEHNQGEARIIQFSSGALSFGCFHQSCQGNDWHALRARLEPGWRERKSSNRLDKSTNGESADPSDSGGEEEPSRKTKQAERLIALVKQLAVTLFHDEYGNPYARVKVGEHFEIWRIRSKQFRQWLSREFWEAKEKVPNSDSLNSALNLIEAKAYFEGDRHELHNRVAWCDDAIWFDLGDWRAAKITKEGWEIVDEPPILFRRYSHQKAQAIPQNSDLKEIDTIFDFVNIKNEEQRLLYKTSLICSLIPDIPHPIDVLFGDQGAAKTTVSQVKKDLVDPSKTRTLTFPGTKSEFVQQVSHHWVYPLDNLTWLPEWLSDALCRAVTGDGFSKRELYTDDDDIIYQFKRCVIINGINLVPTKPDLLDRSLIFELDQIPKEERKNEVELWNEFEGKKPGILGALFSLVSKAMKEYVNVKLPHKPRMADFATWGCAVARALVKEEKEFLTAYFNNIKVQNVEVLEASPVARVIINFMDGKGEWQGTPSELLNELDEIAVELKLDKDKRYPKDSRWLWKRIKEVRTNLQAVGILVDRDDSSHKSGRKILLKWIPRKEEKDSSQQGRETVVPNDVLSQTEQVQGPIGDNIEDKKNVDAGNVHPNHPQSLDKGQEDNKDNSFEALNEGYDSWEAEAKKFLKETGDS